MRFVSTSPTSNTETVIATGLLTAGGSDVEQAHNVGVLRIPGGTIRVRHSAGKGTQSCSQAKPPVAWELIISASGPATLP